MSCALLRHFQEQQRRQLLEVNKRLWLRDDHLKVRTSRSGSPNGVTGVVSALISRGYTPPPDVQVLDLLCEALTPVEPVLRVVRHFVTDQTTSYVIGIGKPFRPGDDKEVGDIWGCLSIRNSGVGFAAASFVASITRLLCKNGMTAPIPDALLFKRAHPERALARRAGGHDGAEVPVSLVFPDREFLPTPVRVFIGTWAPS